jgi:hypothetical protein
VRLEVERVPPDDLAVLQTPGLLRDFGQSCAAVGATELRPAPMNWMDGSAEAEGVKKYVHRRVVQRWPGTSRRSSGL